MKQQFDLSLWLEDKSRKVVTRTGEEVKIIDTNAPDENNPIIGYIYHKQKWNGPWSWHIDGVYKVGGDNMDLFFADEEEELTEFELRLLSSLDYTRIYRQDYSEEDMLKIIKDIAQELLDLARKEIRKEQQEKLGTLEMPIDVTEPYYIKGKEDALKDLPKWKKTTEHKLFNHYVCVMTNNSFPFIFLEKEVHIGDYYYIDLEDLKNLPKEE